MRNIINSTKVSDLINVIKREISNRVVHIFTNQPDLFINLKDESLYRTEDIREFNIIDTNSFRNNKVTDKVFSNILSEDNSFNINEGDAVVFHDFVNNVSFTDKGGNRFINKIMALITNDSLDVYINTDSKLINEIINDKGFNSFHKRGSSVELMKMMMKDQVTQWEQVPGSADWRAVRFTTLNAALSFLMINHGELFSKITRKLYDMIHKYRGNLTLRDQYEILVATEHEAIKIYEFTKLVKATNIDRSFLAMIILNSCNKGRLTENDIMTCQTVMTYSNRFRSGYYVDPKDNWANEKKVMPKNIAAMENSKLYVVMAGLLRKTSITMQDVLSKGVKFSGELLKELVLHAFGANGKVPLDIWNACVTSERLKGNPMVWSELLQNYLDGTDKNMDYLVKRLLEVMGYQGFITTEHEDFHKLLMD